MSKLVPAQICLRRYGISSICQALANLWKEWVAESLTLIFLIRMKGGCCPAVSTGGSVNSCLLGVSCVPAPSVCWVHGSCCQTMLSSCSCNTRDWSHSLGFVYFYGSSGLFTSWFQNTQVCYFEEPFENLEP